MDKLEQLLAAEAIRNLKARYFRCVDRKDWPALAGVFSEDVILDFRQQVAPGTPPAQEQAAVGRDTVVALISKVVGRYRTIHHGHLPEISVAGASSAHGIWAMDDTIRDQEDRLVLQGSGYYHETYNRLGGNDWTISYLRLERLWVIYGEGGRDPAVRRRFGGN
jgi:SnoaL-like domain